MARASGRGHLGPVPGGYAEQAVTGVGQLFAVPDDVGFPDAVAAVGIGRTALGVAARAHADLEGRRALGKVVLTSSQ